MLETPCGVSVQRSRDPEPAHDNWMQDHMHLSAHLAQTTRENTHVSASSIIAMLGGLLLLCSMTGCTLFQASRQCGISECAGDARITADVEARFEEHPSIQPPNNIMVSTLNGVVYLGGDVDSPSAKADAELVARETPGVTGVVNSIVGRQTE